MVWDCIFDFGLYCSSKTVFLVTKKKSDPSWPMLYIYSAQYNPHMSHTGCFGCKKKHTQSLREAPFNKSPPLFGHCPNSIYTPPPHSNGHSGALFFRRYFTILPPCLPLPVWTHLIMACRFQNCSREDKWSIGWRMQYKSKGIGATKQYIKNAHDLYLIPKNVAVKNIANQGHISYD